MSINLVPKRYKLKSRETISRSELVVVTFPSTNSWTSTHQLSLKNWRGRIQSRDSARRSLSKRPSLTTVSERHLLLEIVLQGEETHPQERSASDFHLKIHWRLKPGVSFLFPGTRKNLFKISSYFFSRAVRILFKSLKSL